MERQPPLPVEQTKQNTLRIVKAVVDYLTTASQAKLRQTISYIVAKRRRQGFGHEEVITSMLLLRRSFEKGCGPIDGEAGFLIDAVTRVMVGEVATYLHAINPLEERQHDWLPPPRTTTSRSSTRRTSTRATLQQDLEDVRPSMHLFIVPVPAQYIRWEGGTPIMLALLWSRAAHEPWVCGRGRGHRAARGRHREQQVRHRGVHRAGHGHGWKAVDLHSKKPVSSRRRGRRTITCRAT